MQLSSINSNSSEENSTLLTLLRKQVGLELLSTGLLLEIDKPKPTALFSIDLKPALMTTSTVKPSLKL